MVDWIFMSASSESEFGQTDLDLWEEKIEHGREVFKPWFDRLSDIEKQDVFSYLDLINGMMSKLHSDVQIG